MQLILDEGQIVRSSRLSICPDIRHWAWAAPVFDLICATGLLRCACERECPTLLWLWDLGFLCRSESVVTMVPKQLCNTVGRLTPRRLYLSWTAACSNTTSTPAPTLGPRFGFYKGGSKASLSHFEILGRGAIDSLVSSCARPDPKSGAQTHRASREAQAE